MPGQREQDEIWRDGLKARGKDWVQAELQRRSGQPEDVLLDVVFEPPYPTRAFCQQWCAEEGNRIRFPPTLILAVIFGLLAIVCAQHFAFNAGERATNGAGQIAARPQVAPPSRAAPPPLTNDIPQSAASTLGSGQSPATAPPTATGNASPSTVCAYQTYASAACPAPPQ